MAVLFTACGIARLCGVGGAGGAAGAAGLYTMVMVDPRHSFADGAAVVGCGRDR